MSTPHDDIPPSQHAAIDRALRAIAHNLDQPHGSTDATPTPPPSEWLADLKAALAWVALMAFGTLALAALLSNHIQLG